MSLTLFYHPLSSFCWKALVALYHREIPFKPTLVDLSDATSSAELRRLWPLAKFPVLRDDSNGRVLPESSILIEYLDRFGTAAPLLPADPDAALDVRLWDRFFDNYLQLPMQRIVGDRIAGGLDPKGVADASALIASAYEVLERHLVKSEWNATKALSLADCSAAPALFYATIVRPTDQSFPQLGSYQEHLMQLPAVKKTIDGARPYFPFFPFADAIPSRFR